MHPPIRRQITLEAPPHRVWEAITSAEHLAVWFGAAVEFDAHPGASITVRWPDGSMSRGSIERVEPPRRFAFRWRSMSGAGLSLRVSAPTRVEFTLEPLEEGAGTLVTVTEHDAPLPGPPTPVLSATA